MATIATELEERVTILEDEVALLKREREFPRKQGWENIVGVFADDEYFEEAVRLGEEYRASQRPDE